MKRPIQPLKCSSIGATAAVWLLSAATVSAQPQTNHLRIGVYDSRAVAVAYANSTAFQETMKAVQAEHRNAKAADDTNKLAQIQGQMKLLQRRMHEQGFSTGSVAGIMEKVKPSYRNRREHRGHSQHDQEEP